VQFNSYSYLLGLAAVVLVFWLLPVKFRRVYVLLISIAFYATWDPLLVLLPLGLCSLTYLAALGMQAHPRTFQARRYLQLGIGVVILALAGAKYRGFLFSNLQALRPSLHVPESLLTVALPLGISFYSFELISYLLDTRQGRIGNTGFMDLALFVMFWPHLIAGPIVRFRELVGQLRFARPFDVRMFYAGVERLLVGLVQKNMLANSLGGWVDDGFLPRVAALNSSIDNWALAVAFGLQIYFDFAAYSNMAIGAARMLGIVLPENFRYPYLAPTPPQFWARWHMTLSRWVRDYLFFPLNAGLRHSRLKLYASLLLVMGVVGLWHGAGWGFVAWGLMHGIYLILFRAAVGESLDGKPHWLKLTWRCWTLVGVTAAWIPFRATTLAQARTMLASMFIRPTIGLSYSVNFYLITLLCCALCVAEPWLARLLSSPEEQDHQPAFMRRVTGFYLLRPILFASMLLLFIAFDDRDTQFIYFQF
jgi:alginate O-acetyltransferase complex protein AlgI